MNCFIQKILPGLVLVAALGLAGCGQQSTDLSVAPVSGKVTCQGELLTEGGIVFTPVSATPGTMPGKAAMGKIESDGTFRLTTYVQNDGAVIGHHRVTITIPGEELDDAGGGAGGRTTVKPKKGSFPCAGRSVEVDVQKGSNALEIKLGG